VTWLEESLIRTNFIDVLQQRGTKEQENKGYKIKLNGGLKSQDKLIRLQYTLFLNKYKQYHVFIIQCHVNNLQPR
jgi:hypothetical protein